MNVSNSAHRKLITISSLTVAALVAYLGSIFLLGESFLGFEFHAMHEALLTLALVGASIWLCFVLSKHAPNYVSSATNVQVSILTTVLLMTTVDASYTVIQNAIKPKSTVYDYGHRDSNNNPDEYYPRLYFPTDRNFFVHKPDSAVTASSFGSFYSRDMLVSPTLVNSVLERRTVSITINEFGFREVEPIENARIFALGDSLTFGWGVNADKSWVKRLETRLSVPIYNLGVRGASPKQELELLKFLVNTPKYDVTIQHLLWMIYEGNDLEDDYNETAPAPRPRQQPNSLLSGTVLESLTSIFKTLATFPYAVKSESVINKLLNGTIQFRYSTKRESSHELVDGIRLVHPLFKSDQFGYRLFSGAPVDRGVQQSMSYVLLHPNWPKLEKVFTEMGKLAEKLGFDVTVILAPTADRLHGKYFADFPEASEPYFLELVAGLARKEKFQIINLYDLLRPLADRQLLYFRDDDHWNEDGHLLVATSLSEQLAGWSSERALGQ
jgi:hypothetical protein